MALNGFALGGVADGFNQAQQTANQKQQVNQQGQYQQGLLRLQQQQQQNQQQRELYARADKDIAGLSSTMDETIKAMKLHGSSNSDIAKAIQPIVQPLKRLMKSAGRDDTLLDAQIATTLAQPGFDPKSVEASGSSPSTIKTSSAQPVSSGDVGGDKMPPGQNLTSPGTTITGVSVEDAPLRPNAPPTQPPASPPDDVQRYTTALINLPSYAPQNMKDGIKIRLAEAIKKKDANVEIHWAKDENGNEHPVFVDKQKRTVTDQNGNPYVVPTEGEGGIGQIARAIEEGKQPPVTTGLYKQGAKVRAALAKDGFDLTSANLEYQAATKQIQALNGPQMTRYVGLAKGVVNTIDEIKNLSQQMELSGVPLANRAKLAAYMQTAGNSEGGQLAARYIGAVTTLKEEFANLVQGGYAPTEAAFALANKQINEDYGVKQMAASLTEVQRLIRYRLNAVPNLATRGPGSANRYVPDQQQVQPQSSSPGGAVDWQTYFSK